MRASILYALFVMFCLTPLMAQVLPEGAQMNSFMDSERFSVLHQDPNKRHFETNSFLDAHLPEKGRYLVKEPMPLVPNFFLDSHKRHDFYGAPADELFEGNSFFDSQRKRPKDPALKPDNFAKKSFDERFNGLKNAYDFYFNRKRLLSGANFDVSTKGFSAVKRTEYTLSPFPHLSAFYVQNDRGFSLSHYPISLSKLQNTQQEVRQRFALGHRTIMRAGVFTQSIGISQSAARTRFFDPDNPNTGAFKGGYFISDNWINLPFKSKIGLYGEYDHAARRQMLQATLLTLLSIDPLFQPLVGVEMRQTSDRSEVSQHFGLVITNLNFMGLSFKVSGGIKNTPKAKQQGYFNLAYWKRI